MRTHICFLFCLSFACLSPLRAQKFHTPSDNSITNDRKELGQIETDLLNAYVHRDLSVRDRYVADEFVGVDSSGSVYSKQQDMQDMEDGTFALKSFKEEDVQVRLLGDSAVVTGRNTATSVYKGKEDSFTIRFVDTFVNRDGRWQMVYSQDTNVADGTKESLEREISANEKQMLDLSARKDLEAYGRRLPDDALGVYSDGYASKADVLRAISGMSDLHYSMDDVRVIPVGNAAGLIVYRITQDWKEGGKKLARQYYVSSLWQNRDGKWLNPFWQETDATLSDDDLSTQALAKEREILETLKHNDWSAFSSLLAEDAIAIDEDGIIGKKELIDGIKTAGTVFSDYKMENVKVIPQGNGAIVAYRETLVGTQNGKPFTWHIYTHSHWERRGGKWLMTMFQDSMAKE
ncbi:MAG TPA: nuclear transport factor 2 family protein [Terriglobales bacterium]|nr:nuclear transport factor 2 family protein [Terriglobales bacterium]